MGHSDKGARVDGRRYPEVAVAKGCVRRVGGGGGGRAAVVDQPGIELRQSPFDTRLRGLERLRGTQLVGGGSLVEDEASIGVGSHHRHQEEQNHHHDERGYAPRWNC
jgi:hypothetical protein